MKKIAHILLCVVFSLSLLIPTFGYAATSGTLSAGVKAAAVPQKNVFIYDAELLGHSNANVYNTKINGYTKTILNSTTDLGSNAQATLTYRIKLFNNSEFVYTFNQVIYLTGDGTYDNENITFTLTNLEKGDEIAAKGYLTFDITFSYASSTITNTVLNSVLNFEFVPASEFIPDVAVHNALDKFKLILNDANDYSSLITRMNNAENRLNDTYIGNVVGANNGDTELLNNLFTEDGINYLTLEINGQKTSVTAMIKRDNIDGNAATGDENGNEMTIYLTADDISKNQGSILSPGSVDVFAVVFTKSGANGEWTQFGDMYEGEATVNNYETGSPGGLFTRRDSFNTDTWRATSTYHGIMPGDNATISNLIAAYKATL